MVSVLGQSRAAAKQAQKTQDTEAPGSLTASMSASATSVRSPPDSRPSAVCTGPGGSRPAPGAGAAARQAELHALGGRPPRPDQVQAMRGEQAAQQRLEL